jgi:hypothetical protein
MALKKSFPLLVAVALLCAPQAARADSLEQIIDGGTCIPYPPPPTAGGRSWQHFLYGFSGGIAFCHLTMPQDWPLNTLSTVVFTGWSDGVTTARLCVHALGLAVTCGSAVTISGPPSPYQFSTVMPPSLPPNADGAFVQFNFPFNTVSSGVIGLFPIWVK